MLPILDEIRRVRHEMSAEIGHDPRRILAYYAALSARCRDRLVNYGSGLEQGHTKECHAADDHTVAEVGAESERLGEDVKLAESSANIEI